MSEDRLKLPPHKDFGFWQRRKHDTWREVPKPATLGSDVCLADTHAHVHMLPDPAWELARCAANKIDLVCTICDPAEDGTALVDAVESWSMQAQSLVASMEALAEAAGAAGVADAADAAGAAGMVDAADAAGVELRDTPLRVPTVKVAAGIHPHNARLYTQSFETQLRDWAKAGRLCAIGEIGLDYHYDFSPRSVQIAVFKKQLQLALDLGLPVALHLRDGADDTACAHEQALEILDEVGIPEAGVIVHCCALSPEEVKPWIARGCFIAYGGALTFKKADDARKGAQCVPSERLLLETDAPYMTPEPLRGAACTPAHVVFTAVFVAELLGEQALRVAHDNAWRLLGGHEQI